MNSKRKTAACFGFAAYSILLTAQTIFPSVVFAQDGGSSLTGSNFGSVLPQSKFGNPGPGMFHAPSPFSDKLGVSPGASPESQFESQNDNPFPQTSTTRSTESSVANVERAWYKFLEPSLNLARNLEEVEHKRLLSVVPMPLNIRGGDRRTDIRTALLRADASPEYSCFKTIYGNLFARSNAIILTISGRVVRVLNMNGKEKDVLFKLANGQVITVGPGSEFIISKSLDPQELNMRDGIARRGFTRVMKYNELQMAFTQFSHASVFETPELRYFLSNQRNSEYLRPLVAKLDAVRGTTGFRLALAPGEREQLQAQAREQRKIAESKVDAKVVLASEKAKIEAKAKEEAAQKAKEMAKFKEESARKMAIAKAKDEADKTSKLKDEAQKLAAAKDQALKTAALAKAKEESKKATALAKAKDEAVERAELAAKAKIDAQKNKELAKAKEEALKARELAKAKEEALRLKEVAKAKEEAAQKAAAIAKAKEEAQKAKELAKAKVEAEKLAARKAKEEEQKAKELAEAKANEETRKAKELAKAKAAEEARKAKELAQKEKEEALKLREIARAKEEAAKLKAKEEATKARELALANEAAAKQAAKEKKLALAKEAAAKAEAVAKAAESARIKLAEAKAKEQAKAKQLEIARSNKLIDKAKQMAIAAKSAGQTKGIAESLKESEGTAAGATSKSTGGTKPAAATANASELAKALAEKMKEKQKRLALLSGKMKENLAVKASKIAEATKASAAATFNPKPLPPEPPMVPDQPARKLLPRKLPGPDTPPELAKLLLDADREEKLSISLRKKADKCIAFIEGGLMNPDQQRRMMAQARQHLRAASEAEERAQSFRRQVEIAENGRSPI